jgi:hypothetical protein
MTLTLQRRVTVKAQNRRKFAVPAQVGVEWVSGHSRLLAHAGAC